MSLTGLPLILLTSFLAVLSIAATVLLWSRFGRWRLLSRTVGVLLAESLLVLAAGLVFNRADGFYPSWQALGGETGTASETAVTKAGRLDATVGRNGELPWRPSDLSSWRLAGALTVVLPGGYRTQPSVRFPVVLVLADGPDTATAAVQAASRADGVVTVVATPTAGTTAAALGRLGADLAQDVRVTTRGWGLVTTTHDASLAAQIVNLSGGQYVGEALIGPGQPPGVRLNGPVAFASVRGVGGSPPKPGKSVTPGQHGTSGRPGTAGHPASGGRAGTSGAAGSGDAGGRHGLAGSAGSGGSAGSIGVAGVAGLGGVDGSAGSGGSAGSPGRSGTAGKEATGNTVPHKNPVPHDGKTPHGKNRVPGTVATPGTLATPGKGAVPGKPVAPGRPVTLTCPRGSVWVVAVRWAADQTSRPLQPAIVLPAGTP